MKKTIDIWPGNSFEDIAKIDIFFSDMEIIKKRKIEKLSFPVDGYNYNVMEWRSVDGGKTFLYCGYGKFCKTLEEAEQYANEV